MVKTREIRKMLDDGVQQFNYFEVFCFRTLMGPSYILCISTLIQNLVAYNFPSQSGLSRVVCLGVLYETAIGSWLG